MVQGLAFLSKKGFNPQNNVNRKQVWERQQASKQEEERIRKREAQLKRERDDEDLARAREGERGGSQAQLRFMYDAPPGLHKEKNNQQEQEQAKPAPSGVDMTQIQPGDDAAAAAFRMMLAAQSNNNSNNTDDQRQEEAARKLGFGPNLQGSNSEKTLKKGEMSALEKAVGRKDNTGSLTLEEQVERFPQLKNAPMAKGMNATDVGVAFKPLGAQIKNVKCLACGIWGHSKGDRECSVSGWDPFSSTNRPISTSQAAATTGTSSIRPGNDEIKKHQKRSRRRDDSDDESSSSSSDSDSDSSYERRRRRKRKHRKRKHKSSSRKHRRRHDSDDDDNNDSTSDHKRSRSKKSHKKSSRH
jgi:CBF1 interacting corepressor